MLRATIERDSGLGSPVAAILSGAGVLSAATMKKQPIAAALSGDGTLSATTMKKALVDAALSGGGALSATAAPKIALAATLSGVGVLSATVTDATPPSGHPTDDFNRADNASLGAGWVNRLGTMGVSGNAAAPTTGTWCIATPTTAMSSNDMEASITLGSLIGGGAGNYMVGLGFNSAGEGAFYYANDGGTHYIFSQTVWDNAWTSQVNVSGPITGTGSKLTIRRVGNVYTALVNDVAVSGCNWTDSANLVPRDASHRLVDMATYLGDGPNYRTIDSFEAVSL